MQINLTKLLFEKKKLEDSENGPTNDKVAVSNLKLNLNKPRTLLE
jgi:hypothetical protein